MTLDFAAALMQAADRVLLQEKRQKLPAGGQKPLCFPSTEALNDIETMYIIEASAASRAVSHLVSQKKLLGLDIETYARDEYKNDSQAGLQPRKSKIRLVQIFDGDKLVYVFDILKLGGLQVLGDVIWNRPMIAHNAIFELKHLLHNGVLPKQLGCTLLADRVLNGERRNLCQDLCLSTSSSLKSLAKELLGIDISKEAQTSDWSKEISQEQLEYAALDAVLPGKLWSIQHPRLTKESLLASYQLLRDAQYPVAAMELCGIGFDVEAHKSLIAHWQNTCEELQGSIAGAVGRELNLNSGKQVGEWLKEALKQPELDAWAKTPKGQLSTCTHTFKLHERMHDIFPQLIEYRHVAKKISSFGQSLYKFIDEDTGRLYGAFSLGTTTTGRMASSKPNMQNMPRGDFRKLFCARDGYVLIGLDYSQQELRVAALVTQDPELLRVYEKGQDAHVITAAMVLKIPVDEVKKSHRQLAKALNFGLLYGQGATGLAVYAKRNYGVEMTKNEAEQHRKAFFRAYKRLRAWQIDTGKVTEITQKVYTPGGRVRDFSREQKGYMYTAALNLPIQGGAAEVTLHALRRLGELLSDDVHLVNVVHDEVVLEVREDIAEDIAKKAVTAMEQAFLDVFPDAGPYMSGLVDGKIGKNWNDTK